MTLTRREAATAVRLLGKFQSCLEGLVDAALSPGELVPKDEIDIEPVRAARRDWRASENLVLRLTAKGPSR